MRLLLLLFYLKNESFLFSDDDDHENEINLYDVYLIEFYCATLELNREFGSRINQFNTLILKNVYRFDVIQIKLLNILYKMSI